MWNPVHPLSFNLMANNSSFTSTLLLVKEGRVIGHEKIKRWKGWDRICLRALYPQYISYSYMGPQTLVSVHLILLLH